MKKNFFEFYRIGSVQLRISHAMAADGHVCPHRYHTFGDYTLNGGVGKLWFSKTGIIGLMLVLSLLVKFLVLYLQLKLGSTHLVQLV